MHAVGAALAGAVLLVSLAPRPAAAQAMPYWNVQWGRPQNASAGLGLLLGRIKGDELHIASRALLIEARPGTSGGALHLGYVPLAAEANGFSFAGAALKGTLLRTWATPAAGLAPRQTYAGAELHLAWILKGSVGMLWRVSGGAGKTRVLTWSVGMGL